MQHWKTFKNPVSVAVLARDEGRRDEDRAPVGGGRSAGRLHRPGEPRVPVLHRRTQELGPGPEGGDQGEITKPASRSPAAETVRAGAEVREI